MAHSQFNLPIIFYNDYTSTDVCHRYPLEPLVNLVYVAIRDQKSHENIVRKFHVHAHQQHTVNHLLKTKPE